MVAGGIVVFLRVRGDRQQGVVDVRRRGIPPYGRPVLVLHDDEEHRGQRRGGRRPGRERRGGRGRGGLLSRAGGGGGGGGGRGGGRGGVRGGGEGERRGGGGVCGGERRGGRKARGQTREVRRTEGSPALPEGRHLRDRRADVPGVRLEDGARLHA